MTTKTQTIDFAAPLKDVFAKAQTNAKAAYEKGNVALGDATEFTKGNVEAMVESGKVLAAGLQSLSTVAVAETKSAFETLTADMKAFAAVKSPADFLKLQSEVLRRNFDSAVAYNSKQSEAALKLAGEVVAPISNRVSLAVEKVKAVA